MLVPLPFLTMLAALGVGLRFGLDRGLPRPARALIVATALAAAVAALLVGLRFGYGYEELVRLQRLFPFVTGPLFYLDFLAFALAWPALRRAIAAHLGAAAAITVVFWFAPRTITLLDVAIAVSYIVYIALMVRLWRRGPDALSQARISDAGNLRNWLLGAIALLVFILALDTTIAAAFALGLEAHVPLIIGLGSLPGIAALIYALTRGPVIAAADPRAETSDGEGVFGEVEALMDAAALYRDPALSLDRLARRLGKPAREVSQAINRATGENVSQYVNRRRVAAAAAALEASTETIEEIATAAGFLSRSNFYREFRRIHGETPAAYRKSRQAA